MAEHPRLPGHDDLVLRTPRRPVSYRRSTSPWTILGWVFVALLCILGLVFVILSILIWLGVASGTW